MRQTGAFTKLHISHTRSLQEETPGTSSFICRNTEHPCLDVYTNQLVHRGQPSTSRWPPSTVNVQVRSSASSSSSVGRRLTPNTEDKRSINRKTNLSRLVDGMFNKQGHLHMSSPNVSRSPHLPVRVLKVNIVRPYLSMYVCRYALIYGDF